MDECQPDDKKRKFGESSARGRRGRVMATPSKRRKQNSPDVTTGTSTDKPAKRYCINITDSVISLKSRLLSWLNLLHHSRQ